MDDLRKLALSVARCAEVEQARDDRGHPCHQVVNVQPADDFQVPEGWAGNLLAARICFISSNPSISTPPEGRPTREAENYPRADWSDETIADFTMNRFEGKWAIAEGRHKQIDGAWGKRTRYWARGRSRARELIDHAEPTSDYVMTEVVHCKSKQEKGVPKAVARCAERHLGPILAATSAPLVVVVGAAARDRFADIWSLPVGFGTREVTGVAVAPNVFVRTIGDSARLVVYLTHFTSMEKVRTFNQTYGPGVAHLRDLVAGDCTIEQAEERLKATVLGPAGV